MSRAMGEGAAALFRRILPKLGTGVNI